jgi:hypothetical protein
MNACIDMNVIEQPSFHKNDLSFHYFMVSGDEGVKFWIRLKDHRWLSQQVHVYAHTHSYWWPISMYHL